MIKLEVGLGLGLMLELVLCLGLNLVYRIKATFTLGILVMV